jgi:Secretion system C-terminal sorting domain
MKTIVRSLALSVLLLSVGLGTSWAQKLTVIKSWNYESSSEPDWYPGTGTAPIVVSTAESISGTHSGMTWDSTGLSGQINFQNDTYKVQQGDSITFWVWISSTGASKLNGAQLYWQTGSGWTWNNSAWINGSSFTGNAWNHVGMTFPAMASPLDRIGIQFLAASASDVDTVFIDSITVVRPVDSTLVSQWGIVPSRHSSGWHLTANAMGDTANDHGTSLSGWEAIRGAFSDSITGNTGTNGAVVVSGKITFVGEGPDQWSALRYGLYHQIPDSVGTLKYAGTDSVQWGGVSAEKYSNGYSFMPQTGTAYTGNIPGGFNASQGVCVNGSWISSYAGPGFDGLIQQAPARANMTAGTYDFAFSVHPLTNGTKKVNFYLVKEGNPIPYWYGGSFIDTTSITPTFNGVCFGVESATNMTNMLVTGVHDSLGPDITVPKAPWQAFYVDQWGKFVREAGWHFAVDPDTIIGNAGIAGSAVPTGNWATIRGGFTIPVTATPESAIVVTGQITFVGSGPVTWSGLRYGLFRQDTAGTVQYANTDSARWGSINYKGTDSATFVPGKENAFGYMFTPQSGTAYTGNIPSFANGGASQGVTKGGSWISTYGGAAGFGGMISQQPARASFAAGTYNWAVSVQPVGNHNNEVRFYMYRDSSVVTYWYGGTLEDTSQTTDTFNGVCFGLDPNYSQTTSPISAMILTNVKVDLGAPITVPAPPWQNYYVDTWGFYGGHTGGWGLRPGIVGNVDVGGSSAVTGSAVVRGQFFSPVTPIDGKDSSLVITGDIDFVGGGFQTPGSFRIGLFNGTQAGNTSVDTTADTSFVWSGTDGQNSGYLFIPQSGTNAPMDWYGHTQGSWGGIMNGVWDSTNSGYVLGNGVLKPAGAVGGPGSYSFELSVAPAGNGASLVGFEMASSDSSYVFGESAVDNHSPVAASSFNSIIFELRNGTGATAMNLSNIYVTMAPSPTVTGVKNAGAGIPKVYALYQNYPNPFNPSTVIEYDLPKVSNVTVRVYDVLGREVATLVNGKQSAGSYKLTFNMDRYASGVYFVRLNAGSYTHTQKMMLLK